MFGPFLTSTSQKFFNQKHNSSAISSVVVRWCRGPGSRGQEPLQFAGAARDASLRPFRWPGRGGAIDVAGMTGLRVETPGDLGIHHFEKQMAISRGKDGHVMRFFGLSGVLKTSWEIHQKWRFNQMAIFQQTTLTGGANYPRDSRTFFEWVKYDISNPHDHPSWAPYPACELTMIGPMNPKYIPEFLS